MWINALARFDARLLPFLIGTTLIQNIGTQQKVLGPVGDKPGRNGRCYPNDRDANGGVETL
eukprot:9478165-Pyramimonas_sp.AAC.1